MVTKVGTANAVGVVETIELVRLPVSICKVVVAARIPTFPSEEEIVAVEFDELEESDVVVLFRVEFVN